MKKVENAVVLNSMKRIENENKTTEEKVVKTDTRYANTTNYLMK